MLINPFTFHAPETLSEAAKLYAKLDNAKILAGGTFLVNILKLSKKKERTGPEHIISLQNIADLKGITSDKNRILIKAMTTIGELMDSPFLTDNFTVIKTVCEAIGTTPIRNMATIGGNLTCRYTWTEMPTVLLALDATLHFVDAKNKEEAVPIETFLKNKAKTDKILRYITIARDKNAKASYLRIKTSVAVDTPIAAVCIKASVEKNKWSNTRASINTGTAFTQRDVVLEKFLDSNTSVDQAAQNLDEKIYTEGNDTYKKHMLRVSVETAIEELNRGQTPISPINKK